MIEAYKPYLIPFALVALVVLTGTLIGLLRLRRKAIRSFTDWRALAANSAAAAVAGAGEGAGEEAKRQGGSALVVGEPTADEKRQLV
jgi:hypothetical protein